jgi:hypothetical protein
MGYGDSLLPSRPAVTARLFRRRGASQHVEYAKVDGDMRLGRFGEICPAVGKWRG